MNLYKLSSEYDRVYNELKRIGVDSYALNMVKKGEVLKIGGGRYTAYVWNRENE